MRVVSNILEKFGVIEIMKKKHHRARFSYDLLLNWAVTSTKVVDMACSW
jgi:hypothetical protein